MKTIIIAIDNPKIFNEIKKDKNIKIIGKDLIYKEAVLELLEKNKNIDLIILYEKILGEINFFELIKKKKNINKKIKIIIILENKNEKLENKFKKINIKNIYLKNKINSKKIIEIINEKNINKNNKNNKNKKIEKNKFIKSKNKRRKEKIINIKKYFFQSLKKIKNKFFLIKKYIQNFINKFFNSKSSKIKKIKSKNKSRHNEKKKNETILILGNKKSGKTLISLLLAQKLEKQNNKISIINLSNNTKNKNKNNKLWHIQKEIEDDLKIYNSKTSILKCIKNSKVENRKIENTKNKKFKELKKAKNEKEKNKIKKIEKIKKLNNNKLKNNKIIENKKQKNIKIKINKNKILKKYKLKNNKKEKNNKKIKIKSNKLIKKYKLKINKNKINKYLKNKKIEKNKIKNEKILKRIKNNLSKRLNRNINYYSNFNFIKKYEKANYKNYEKKEINIILKIIKAIQKETKYTIIEMNSLENIKLTNEIIKNTDKIIFLIEANYLGIKRGQEILERLKDEKYLNKKGLHIIFNKIEKNKISNKILEEIFKDYKIIENIKFNRNFTRNSFNSILKNKNKVNLKI